MKTYKYNVEVVSQTFINVNEFPKILNNMGKDGWRVISIVVDNRTLKWTIVYEKEE